MRKFKVTGSWGVYDAYKKIRSNGWYNIGKSVTEHEFYSILRNVNKLLVEEIATGHSVRLPSYMGKLELRKSKRGVYLDNGKLKITYAVDWESTKKLWEKDSEAKRNKSLIRFENPYIYKVVYNKKNAKYENKLFYQFTTAKYLKQAIKRSILNGTTDSAWEF